MEKRKEEEEKPMYLKDYERRQLLERGVMAGVSDSESEDNTEVRFYTRRRERERHFLNSLLIH